MTTIKLQPLTKDAFLEFGDVTHMAPKSGHRFSVKAMCQKKRDDIA